MSRRFNKNGGQDQGGPRFNTSGGGASNVSGDSMQAQHGSDISRNPSPSSGEESTFSGASTEAQYHGNKPPPPGSVYPPEAQYPTSASSGPPPQGQATGTIGHGSPNPASGAVSGGTSSYPPEVGYGQPPPPARLTAGALAAIKGGSSPPPPVTGAVLGTGTDRRGAGTGVAPTAEALADPTRNPSNLQTPTPAGSVGGKAQSSDSSKESSNVSSTPADGQRVVRTGTGPTQDVSFARNPATTAGQRRVAGAETGANDQLHYGVGADSESPSAGSSSQESGSQVSATPADGRRRIVQGPGATEDMSYTRNPPTRVGQRRVAGLETGDNDPRLYGGGMTGPQTGTYVQNTGVTFSQMDLTPGQLPGGSQQQGGTGPSTRTRQQ